MTLFGGLVTADRVTRTARAEAGLVDYGGSVSGLVVDGTVHGDREGTATFRSGGAAVTVNDEGAGLTVRLTRAVAGFASGTTVAVADVTAEAIPGADPDAPRAEPTPAPTATPDPLARPAAAATTRSRPSRRSRGSRPRSAWPAAGSSSPSTATSTAPTTSAARARSARTRATTASRRSAARCSRSPTAG